RRAREDQSEGAELVRAPGGYDPQGDHRREDPRSRDVASPMRSALILALIVVLLSGADASASSRQLRVAYVTDVVASPSPHTLRGSALLGFERAVREFHVQPRVVQFDPKQGAGPTVESLARQGYDLLLIGEVQSGYDFGAVIAAALKFPKEKI